jgi:hypothetical protein
MVFALLSMLVPLPPNVRLLACAAQTEAHPLTMHRQEAAEWVAHVALNRAEAGWWGSLEETLLQDFHAMDQCSDPEPWAVQVALAARNEPDPTGGALFVLSLDDLNRLGYVEPMHSFSDGRVGLCFYRRWHWN